MVKSAKNNKIMATKKENDIQKFQMSKTEKIFALIKDENNKVNIVLGGYCVSSKKFDTFQQADQYIATKPYELLINICAAILTKHNEEKQTTQTENEK